MMKFHFTNSKLKKNIFSTKNLIEKYQISTSRGAKAPLNSPYDANDPNQYLVQ